MSTDSKPAWSDILTVDQVAAYLQLNRLTIYRYIRRGQLRAAKVGKAYRVRKADVDVFLDSLQIRPAARRSVRAVRPEAAPGPRPAPVPGVSRSDSADLRDRELSLGPLEWATRGLH